MDNSTAAETLFLHTKAQAAGQSLVPVLYPETNVTLQPLNL